MYMILYLDTVVSCQRGVKLAYSASVVFLWCPLEHEVIQRVKYITGTIVAFILSVRQNKLNTLKMMVQLCKPSILIIHLLFRGSK